WTYVRPDAWCLVVAFVATPLVAALNLAQPYLIKRVIDEAVVPSIAEGASGDRLELLRELALLYLGAVVIGYVLEAIYTLAVAWGGQRTILRLREALYRHTIRLSSSFFDRVPAGRLMTRLTSDVESLGDALSAGVVTIALDLLMVVGTISAMVWLDASLALLLLAVAPPLLWILNLLRRRLRDLYLEVRDALASVNAFLAEHIDGIEVIQIFRHEATAQSRFEERNARFRRATCTSNWFDALMFAIVDGFSSIAVAGMLWYGSGLAAGWGLPAPEVGAISAGVLVAFIDYLDRLFRPLRDLSQKVAVIQRAAAALTKIFALLDVDEVMDLEGETLPLVRGRLEVRDVHFRYQPESPDVLRGVNLTVEQGAVVAIVGATGSGKTTLARLLERSYEGYRGSILLDGHEVSGLALQDLRGRIGSVRQDIQLFTESLGFNVGLGNERISVSDCAAAASLTHADRVVERLGWAHVLRERGRDLSVGEGQLVTFARTMAHDPELIILDEATASVDSVTEALVQSATSRILEQKTVLVIAHRLSTVQSADRIAVMDHGRVVEEGTHGELLAAGGAYAALVRAGQEALGLLS
ncbi:MAG: ABC transporter ATP-binding protein, partial [Myxococcota bacterium]|nr:ABC transporter ATP-binding protein [Myxococcota bacterium]